ncbi:MAG: DUF3524 domain-containing protein [Pseudomonadales bacterium]|nr:DUF3524 domain-containing protein [Pseudomonadales bacterium]
MNTGTIKLMKILILSPYDAPSHQYWWKGLVNQFSEHKCTVISLPARYFSWRFRGNSLTLSQDLRLQDSYDLIIATSMTDLSALRGLCPRIISTPTIFYFHENQFAYPDLGNKHHLVERQITSIYAALAADALVFNSRFNQESFLSGVAALLRKLPDGIPPGITEKLLDKSQIISVALEPMSDPKEDNSVKKGECFNIVWNHRWEHDKGCDELATFVSLLLESDIDFTFHLIGQKFRKVPEGIKESLSLLKENNRLGHSGFIEDKQQYHRLLRDSHLVLSTARHEFQGLAVLEAIQAGCMPVVPDALAYQEFVPKENRYQNLGQALALVEKCFHANLSANKITTATLPIGVDQKVVFEAWGVLLADLSL